MATTIFLLLLLLLLLPLLLSTATAASPEQEKLTLLQLKSHWNSPSSLSSWSNSSSSSHCSWFGIFCTTGTVTNITLIDQGIDGDVPTFVCDLANLTVLDLFNNSIHNPLPTSLSSCTNLLHLNLGQNYVNGTLPSDLTTMLPKTLVYLNLGGNEITGDIPKAIGEFTALQSLYLDNNYFTSFPLEISKLTNLEVLTLAKNPFMPARLPLEYGELTKLNYLWISEANLTGEIPDWVGSLPQLEHLDLAMNYLTGAIPPSIWGLKNLKYIYLYKNKLNGGIPAKIGALGLQEIDVSMNSLNGSIPQDFSKLESLRILFMYYNSLSGEIPAGISRITTLSDIRLFNNQLSGTLPPDLGKYSQLYNFEITYNNITGALPETLCAKGQLQFIAVYSNRLTGNVPESLGNCSTLRAIKIQQNQLSGEFPANIWSLPNLKTLMISDNDLSGELPDKLPISLTRLEMYNNRFAGRIPTSAEQLNVLYASNNAFSGELPSDFSGIANLQQIMLDGNMISGDIPPSIGELKHLTMLNLSRNQLTGAIPASIGSLLGLNYLDLSSNHLSGEIPDSFDHLKLNALNLSSNSLTGQIPSSLRSAVYDRSFLSNPRLCSGTNTPLFNLPNCSIGSKSSRELPKWLYVLIVALGTVTVLAVTLFAFFALRDFRLRRQLWDRNKSKITSFQYLDFTEPSIVRQLIPENRVGSGGAGEVYRASLGNREGDVVAVKKIWNNKKVHSRLQKEFQAEVEILGSIRHVNIVKLLCCISSHDAKMLVYEYMENGSLFDWLHTTKMGERGGLDWPTRLEIALGAAKGLCYMHHNCDPPVVHWDVKSSNILLDAELRPKIADFGLARILSKGIGEANSFSTVAGSFGYLAPECAYSSKVNEKVDVYGFGVVLLELTTGKRAHEGGGDRSLAEWAWMHFQKGGSVMDAIDEKIKNPFWNDEITAVVKLALACTGTLPSTRPAMKDVVTFLLRFASLHSPKEKDGEENERGPLLHKAGARSHRGREITATGEEKEKEDMVGFISCSV